MFALFALYRTPRQLPKPASGQKIQCTRHRFSTFKSRREDTPLIKQFYDLLPPYASSLIPRTITQGCTRLCVQLIDVRRNRGCRSKAVEALSGLPHQFDVLPAQSDLEALRPTPKLTNQYSFFLRTTSITRDCSTDSHTQQQLPIQHVEPTRSPRIAHPRTY